MNCGATPLLKELFLLTLIYTWKDGKGIASEKSYETLWSVTRPPPASGCAPEDVGWLEQDWNELQSLFTLFDNKTHPTYLRHNKKPLVVIWGVGFNEWIFCNQTCTLTIFHNASVHPFPGLYLPTGLGCYLFRSFPLVLIDGHGNGRPLLPFTSRSSFLSGSMLKLTSRGGYFADQ